MLRTDKQETVLWHVVTGSFVQASDLLLLKIHWFRKSGLRNLWKIWLQKGADFLGSEGICAWRHSSQQGVVLCILQTELLQVCSCLGNLHSAEPSLPSWRWHWKTWHGTMESRPTHPSYPYSYSPFLEESWGRSTAVGHGPQGRQWLEEWACLKDGHHWGKRKSLCLVWKPSCATSNRGRGDSWIHVWPLQLTTPLGCCKHVKFWASCYFEVLARLYLDDKWNDHIDQGNWNVW